MSSELSQKATRVEAKFGFDDIVRNPSQRETITHAIEQMNFKKQVYETWNYKGLNITLSHSNMKLLHDLEGSEDDKILREIVVHPDGLVSGSWYRNKKILAE
jgi:hypothetical protein